MFTFVADELLPMPVKFSTKLALIIALSCAAPVIGQDNQLIPIEQTVEDVSRLSTSFRYIEPGLVQPAGFEQVFRYSGRTDLFVRVDGAIHAVFPQSIYEPVKRGVRPTVPPGTVFYIGDPQLQDALSGNFPQPAQTEGLSNNDSPGRLMWRVEPIRNMSTQPERRIIGTKRVQLPDSIEADKRSMSKLKESDAPDIVANSTYRNDRIHTLMKIAADAAMIRRDESDSSETN